MKNLLLQKLEKLLETFLAKIAKAGRQNLVLWGIERSRYYAETRRVFLNGLLVQTSQFLRSEMLKEIENRVGGHPDKIWTEADSKQIEDLVEKHFKVLSNFIEHSVILTFYIWLANQGGQAFIDKMRAKRVKKAVSVGVRFDLKDTQVIEELSNRQDLLITSLDKTTKKFLIKKIIAGKQNHLSEQDIANDIREIIPQTYENRANAIVRTEMTDIVNRTELTAAIRSDAQTKVWVTAGDNVCEDCQANEDAGEVGINGSFPNGNTQPPAHTNCKCLLDYNVPLFLTPEQFWNGG